MGKWAGFKTSWNYNKTACQFTFKGKTSNWYSIPRFRHNGDIDKFSLLRALRDFGTVKYGLGVLIPMGYTYATLTPTTGEIKFTYHA